MKNKKKECAQILLEVMPQIWRVMKEVAQKKEFSKFSVAQFRTLKFINRNNKVSLSEISKHLGPGLSSTSKLIDGLVEKKLIKRQINEKDRRYITITLTKTGKNIMERIQKETIEHLEKSISDLSDSQYSLIINAMEILKQKYISKGEK
jgi:DNA-binding MarR family transcriptional regulator